MGRNLFRRKPGSDSQTVGLKPDPQTSSLWVGRKLLLQQRHFPHPCGSAFIPTRQPISFYTRHLPTCIIDRFAGRLRSAFFIDPQRLLANPILTANDESNRHPWIRLTNPMR